MVARPCRWQTQSLSVGCSQPSRKNGGPFSKVRITRLPLGLRIMKRTGAIPENLISPSMANTPRSCSSAAKYLIKPPPPTRRCRRRRSPNGHSSSPSWFNASDEADEDGPATWCRRGGRRRRQARAGCSRARRGSGLAPPPRLIHRGKRSKPWRHPQARQPDRRI